VSRITSPPETPSAIEMEPSALSGTTAALTIVCPRRKFRVETGGNVPPFGQSVRKPGPAGFVTVALSEIASAFAGRLHTPTSV
jgi:hypothetical protein